MPTVKPMTRMRTRRPWWVAPGLGALLGAGIIAVAAQGSLAGGHVVLPVGPRLAPAVGTPATVGTRPAPAVTVVAPVHAVVTEAASSAAASTSSSGGGASTSGEGGAAVPQLPADANGATEPSASPVGGTTDTTEAGTITTPPTPLTTTTTSPGHEPGDT